MIVLKGNDTNYPASYNHSRGEKVGPESGFISWHFACLINPLMTSIESYASDRRGNSNFTLAYETTLHQAPGPV
jgi:hypothetical protein